jgi:hypothetical protein
MISYLEKILHHGRSTVNFPEFKIRTTDLEWNVINRMNETNIAISKFLNGISAKCASWLESKNNIANFLLL